MKEEDSFGRVLTLPSVGIVYTAESTKQNGTEQNSLSNGWGKGLAPFWNNALRYFR